MHISSSYAKILGGTNFRTWEIPRSGSKAKDGEKKKKRKEERLNDGNNNGQNTHGARKHAWRTQGAWANIHNIFQHLKIHVFSFSVPMFYLLCTQISILFPEFPYRNPVSVSMLKNILF